MRTKEKTPQPERRAFAIADLLATLAVLAIAAGLLLPALAGNNIRALRMQCSANLRQVTLAFHVWAVGNNDLPPQAYAGNFNYPPLSGGMLANGWPVATTDPSAQVYCPDTYLIYLTMSNELNNPKVVVCPADDRPAKTNFSGNEFGNPIGSTGGRNLSVSYFAGRDVNQSRPNMFLAGDRDICADTSVVPIPNNGCGVSPDGSPDGNAVGFATNIDTLTRTFHVGWSPVRMHQGSGNVALADGSVRQFNNAGLVNAFAHSGDTGTSSGGPNVLLFP